MRTEHLSAAPLRTLTLAIGLGAVSCNGAETPAEPASGGSSVGSGGVAVGGSMALGGDGTGGTLANTGGRADGSGGKATGGSPAGGTASGGTTGRAEPAPAGLPVGRDGSGGDRHLHARSKGREHRLYQVVGRTKWSSRRIPTPGSSAAPSSGPRTWGEPRSTRSSSGERVAALRTDSRTRRPWARSPPRGYFIVADGTPGGTAIACAGGQDGKAFLDYITWAIAENGKSCSAYYQSLDTTKIAADGFSCGGLMSENVSGDPRFTAIGHHQQRADGRESRPCTTRSTRRSRS